jgi:hypothetical protein
LPTSDTLPLDGYGSQNFCTQQEERLPGITLHDSRAVEDHNEVFHLNITEFFALDWILIQEVLVFYVSAGITYEIPPLFICDKPYAIGCPGHF